MFPTSENLHELSPKNQHKRLEREVSQHKHNILRYVIHNEDVELHVFCLWWCRCNNALITTTLIKQYSTWLWASFLLLVVLIIFSNRCWCAVNFSETGRRYAGPSNCSEWTGIALNHWEILSKSSQTKKRGLAPNRRFMTSVSFSYTPLSGPPQKFTVHRPPPNYP